ncbi:YigZ family protein [Phaeobacter sp. B1627]|uniref:YigZ family protein n=1 Tax=Phaeobacter sp. B1627 TaxID=2583809 RepID=UPI00111A348F|nr:YigZ family protein [Phaeobacter sp. B1627]
MLTDRGSKYAVSGAGVRSRAEVDAVLARLKEDRSYARATHNTWAAILPTGGLKADDGESGAAMVILRMMEREGLQDHVIIVTRWYGGKKLGGDRFRRVQDAVRAYVDATAGHRAT